MFTCRDENHYLERINELEFERRDLVEQHQYYVDETAKWQEKYELMRVYFIVACIVLGSFILAVLSTIL